MGGALLLYSFKAWGLDDRSSTLCNLRFYEHESSSVWHRVVLSVFTDVSEKPATSIFIRVALCNVPKFKTLFQTGWANPGLQVPRATKFCMVRPKIFGSVEWNSLPITLLARRILKYLLYICKTCDVLPDIWKTCEIPSFTLLNYQTQCCF